jgi:hypothetical protein
MNRWMSAAFVLCVAIGCSSTVEDSSPPTGAEVVSPEVFTGTWRSVTPTMEFVRLAVHSLSVERGGLGARLTYSGVAWEGGGRIEGDSLVATMTILGGGQATGVLVGRPRDARTLLVRMRPEAGTATEFTFVRDD